MQTLYDYLGNALNIGGGAIDVTLMGVDNTGMSDAAEAINTLIADGGTFFFPKGTYLLNSQMVVPSNTTIIGDGSETVFKAASSMDAVYNTICNTNASNINARLCRNVSANGYPATSEIITAYDHDIVLYNFSVNGNWQNRNLVTWNRTYSDKGTTVTREPGTNLEIQAAYNVVIDHVYAYNGIQHNINIRAGAFSYNMGLTYDALFPSYECVIRNCTATNERYDDCITTHDSYNILIDNCVCDVNNNANGTYSNAVSNGIEIDDGSRFVEVRNCKTFYALCGFQAKGHSNTPPAHDVTFRNCTAYYTSTGFSIACAPESSYNTDQTVERRCRNINIIDCAVIKPYAFSNVVNWLGSLRYIDMVNTLDVKILNLYVENSGAPSGAQNDYGQPLRTLCVNMRETCYNTFIEGVQITHPITNTYNSGSLFAVPGNSANVIIRDVRLNGFTGNPVIRATKNDASHYLIIDGVISKRLDSGDKILQVASVASDSDILLLGDRRNMIFL